MALDNTQKADLVFKKISAGKTTSSILTSFFEELVSARRSIFASDIWTETDLIPSTAPVSTGGVVEVITDFSLTHIPGGDSLAFYDPIDTVKDIIPFDFDPAGSYIYQFKTDGDVAIPFGLNDWYFDPEGGVLTFFDGFPSGVTSLLPPKISCWKYIGAKGIGSSASIGTDAKESCTYVATTNIGTILSASQITVENALDPVSASAPTIALDDRVLIKSQTDKKENGIYRWNGTRLERAADQNGTPTNEVSAGNFTFVEEGDNFADTGWLLKGKGIITLGSDDLEWAQFTGAGTVVLGIPTDGNYGTDGNQPGEISGIDAGDSLEDALDKIESILTLLAPAKPPNLSAVSMSMSGIWSAKEHITGITTVDITQDTQPIGLVSTLFFDASTGTLTGKLDTVADGVVTFTQVDDTGLTDGGVTILSESVLDNFWQQATAQFQTTSPITPGTTTRTYELDHSLTGVSNLDFHVDDAQLVPLLTVNTIIGVHTSGKKVSGVPTLSNTDTIESTFDVGDAVSYYYHLTRIARVESAYTADADVPYSQTLVSGTPISTTPPTRGDQVNVVSFASIVSNSIYTEDTTLVYFGQNSRGDDGSIGSGSTSIRIDTVSDETLRVKSGVGSFPAFGVSAGEFGDTYDSTESLTLNEELQLIDGIFKYPPSVDYSGNLPTTGPSYVGLSGKRWTTFSVGSVTNEFDFTFDIIGTVGFGTNTLVSGIDLFLQVEGDTFWIDGNAAYPGFGDPGDSSNGDPGLVMASSSATTKKVTFGGTLRTGNVYVRIGLPDSSTKTFTDIQ